MKRHARLKHFSQSIFAGDLTPLPHDVVQVIEDDFQNIVIPERPSLSLVPGGSVPLTTDSATHPVGTAALYGS